MNAERRRHLAQVERETLAARRQRLADVPIGQRLLETIAWSAVMLADDLCRGAPRPERALPVGLGKRAA